VKEEVMVKLLVMYNQPADVEAFRDHYFTMHVPLARKIENVRSVEVSTLSSLDGTAAPYYLVTALSFDSSDDLMGGLASESGQAAAADLANFAQAGVTMAVANVDLET
jgi:uncharacterized protein (TIGR02118 family)